jgi:hypothetical protein
MNFERDILNCTHLVGKIGEELFYKNFFIEDNPILKRFGT